MFQLQASLIGSWEKLELWGNTHLALFAFITLVCILEAVLLKLTTSARLFTGPHHYDFEYENTDENEDDIYDEEFTIHYNEWVRPQLEFRSMQQETESHITQQTPYSNYNLLSDDDNHLNSSSYHLTSVDVFCFAF